MTYSHTFCLNLVYKLFINTNSQMLLNDVEKKGNYSQSYTLKFSLGNSDNKRLFHVLHNT